MTSNTQSLPERVDQPLGPLLNPHTRPHVIAPPAPTSDPPAAVDSHAPAGALDAWA